MPKQLKKRGYVYFPADLRYVGSSGAGRFVTRVEHRLPDDTPVVWTSRRHRKARGLKIACAKRPIEHPRQIKAQKRKYLLWGYRPKTISW